MLKFTYTKKDERTISVEGRDYRLCDSPLDQDSYLALGMPRLLLCWDDTHSLDRLRLIDILWRDVTRFDPTDGSFECVCDLDGLTVRKRIYTIDGVFRLFVEVVPPLHELDKINA